MNLQEIEKVEEPKILYSLLMPWELGKSVAGLNTPFLTRRRFQDAARFRQNIVK